MICVQITMDTSTSYPAALDMPLPEVMELWYVICEVTGVRHELEQQEIEKARQGVNKP